MERVARGQSPIQIRRRRAVGLVVFAVFSPNDVGADDRLVGAVPSQNAASLSLLPACAIQHLVCFGLSCIS
jgi:hypothetical protein